MDSSAILTFLLASKTPLTSDISSFPKHDKDLILQQTVAMLQSVITEV